MLTFSQSCSHAELILKSISLRKINMPTSETPGPSNSWRNKLLQGTWQHFSCYLPARSGWLSTALRRLFYSGIRVDPDQLALLQNLPDNAITVYAISHKSIFEYLFFHTRYPQIGHPCPEIGLDYRIHLWQPLGRLLRIFMAHALYLLKHRQRLNPYHTHYIQDQLLEGHTGLLSLVERKGFHRRFVKDKVDPLHYLIHMQHSCERPIYIVPQIMFFSNTPERSQPGLTDVFFGTEREPGLIRRTLALFRRTNRIFVEISEPVSLNDFLQRAPQIGLTVEQQTRNLRHYLLKRIHRHRQSTLGPLLKSPEEIKENILTHARLQEFITRYAETRSLSLSKVHKEAEACIEEIAARYNPAFINIASGIVRRIVDAAFEGFTLNEESLRRVKIASQKGPLILIPCHKSHIDYLILSYILFQHNMQVPHIAAGKNLSFWPLGPLFRAGGAFFIRRSFRGAVLYARVFAEYIHYLLEEGANIEFFIEGGRSRTGKLILPKLGLLSILLEAYKNGACEDLFFVPVFIGYDRVLEEGAYIHELEGGQKKPESLWQLIRAPKFLKKRYGRIYLKFNEPISIREVLAREGKSLQEMTSKEQNALCRNLGFRVLNAIDEVSVVTPHALVAGALLNIGAKRFSLEELMTDIDTYMNYLFFRNAKLADTLLLGHAFAVEQVVESFAQRNFIERMARDDGDALSAAEFKVVVPKRPILEYYKNNCIVFFIPAVFTSLAVLNTNAFQFSSQDIATEYKFLRHLFKNEFAYNVDQTPEYHVRKSIKAFMNDAMLMPHPTLPEAYNITSGGFRKLKLFAGFLKTYLESYWVVLNFFMRYPKNTVDAKARNKKILSRGNRMYKRREISCKEALSKINYQNAVDFFNTNGVSGSEDKEQIEFYGSAIQRYLKLLG